MNWSDIISGICAAIVAIYGLWKGIAAVIDSSAAGKEKRASKEQKDAQKRKEEIVAAVEPLLEPITNRMNELEEKIQHNIDCDEERDAIQSRIRIQRSSDDIQHDIKHSKEYWNSVLLDITNYNNYCAKHPDFSNEVTILAEENIRNNYKIGNFL